MNRRRGGGGGGFGGRLIVGGVGDGDEKLPISVSLSARHYNRRRFVIAHRSRQQHDAVSTPRRLCVRVCLGQNGTEISRRASEYPTTLLNSPLTNLPFDFSLSLSLFISFSPLEL